MKTNKILIGGLAGGISYFLLGWLVYGLILFDTMALPEATMNAIGKDPMLMWAMLLSCLVYGIFIAYIFVQWAGISTFTTGLKAGAIIGFFVSLSINLSMFSMYTFPTMTNMLLDVVAAAITTGLAGGIAGLAIGYKQSSKE